jgi:hypothetical protein
MSVDHLNEIISIFIQQNTYELSDSDLSNACRHSGRPCSTEEIRQVVQSLGSSLFQFRLNNDGVFVFRVEPTVRSFNLFLVIHLVP